MRMKIVYFHNDDGGKSKDHTQVPPVLAGRSFMGHTRFQQRLPDGQTDHDGAPTGHCRDWSFTGGDNRERRFLPWQLPRVSPSGFGSLRKQC